MMRNYSNDVFKNKIQEILGRHEELQNAHKEIQLFCKNRLLDLRENVISNGFLNQKDEIYFFKVTKQEPLHNFIYYSELLLLEAEFPKSDLKFQKKYIKIKTKELRQKLFEHKKFIKYIKLKENYLDRYYFTRKYFYKMSLLHWGNVSSISDPKFNTSHDTVLAQTKAYERLIEYLNDRILQSKLLASEIELNLKWTSSKVSLTELIYGLYHSNVINNGNADIKEIGNTFEKAFNIELGDLYRTYTEIQGRKKNRLKFLNELTYTLSNCMEPNL